MRLTLPLIATVLQPCAPLVLDVDDGGTPPDEAGTLVITSDDGRPGCDHAFPSAAEAERAGATCAPGDAAWSDGRAHATLQDAVDAAPDGGAVLVCPGVHTGTVRVANRTLELSSLHGDPTEVTLRGPDRALLVEDADLTVSDLTLEGSDVGRDDGGAIAQDGGSLRLLRVVSRNHEARSGGALWFSGDVLAVEASTLEGSSANNGGGLAIARARCAVVADSTLSGHTAAYSGGAIHADEVTDLLLVDDTFEGNVSGYEGGAVSHGAWEDGHLQVTGGTFTDNFADYGGGAVQVGSWATMTLDVTGATFEHNRAGYEGGAVSANAQGTCHVDVRDATFADNEADYDGGALQVGGWEDDTLVVTGGSFVGNRAGHAGGAVAAGGWGDQTTTLVDVTFTDNEAGAAAAVGLGGNGFMDGRIEGGSFDGNVADASSAALGLGNGRFQVVHTDFGASAANSPADADSECGTQILGIDASFTCDRGVWSVP